MPVGALLAPIIAEAVLPELGIAAGTLGAGAVTAGLGAGLGAGSGALFGELTGGDPGKGALSGAIGGAAGPIGGAIGGAIPGIGEVAGSTIGAAAGGAGGAALTGGNPLLGAAESAAVPLTNAAFGSGGIFGGSTPSATVTPTATATGAAGPAASGGSIGAQSAAAGSQLGLDPTATGGGGAGGGISGSGGAGVDGSSAMGLSSPNSFLVPGTDTPLAGQTFSAAGDASGGGFGSDIMGLLQKNPGALLSGGLLASQLFRGNQQYPAEKSLQTMATNTGTQGAALSSYIQSGTLPPGAQQAVTQATQGAKAEMRSRFAKEGLAGSTMEGQALANIDQQAAAQTFQFADQLLRQGANFTQLSAQIQEALLKQQAGTDEEFQRSLMAFAGGLGGLRGTTG